MAKTTEKLSKAQQHILQVLSNEGADLCTGSWGAELNTHYGHFETVSMRVVNRLLRLGYIERCDAGYCHNTHRGYLALKRSLKRDWPAGSR